MAVILETHRLRIESPSMTDLDQMVDMHASFSNQTTETIRQWLENDIAHFNKHGFAMGSVYEKETNVFVGRAGLVFLDHNDEQPDIEVGYEFHRAFWNKGYATELANALIEWGFPHLHVNKLVAVTRPHNLQSRRVLEKSGMHFIRIMRIRDEDFLLYEITRKMVKIKA